MWESRVSARGQTTVPGAILDSLRAEAGTCLEWHLLADGSVLIRAKAKPIGDSEGALRLDGRSVRTEDVTHRYA
jgi:antitoxin PrlF